MSYGTIPYKLASGDTLQLRPGSRAELDLTDEECLLINTGGVTEDEKRRSYEAYQKWVDLSKKYHKIANPDVEVKGF